MRLGDGRGLGARHPAPARRRTSSRGFDKLPPDVRARALEPYLLNLTKANSRATVHRPAYLDYVGVKRFDASGQVVGERRFLGLYTHTAYHASPREIPILRRKVARGARTRRVPARQPQREGADRDPRDPPARRAVPDLRRRAVRDRDGHPLPRRAPALRLFVRRDTFGPLPLVPGVRAARPLQHREPAPHRARSCKHAFRRLEHRLHDARLGVGARAASLPVYTEPGRLPDFDAREIEMRLVAATRSWADDLESALIGEYGEERGSALRRQYGEAFPAAYRADWVPALRARRHRTHSRRSARRTTWRSASTGRSRRRRACCARRCSAPGRRWRSPTCCPLFENMGVKVADERPYQVTPSEAAAVLDLRLRPHLRRRATSSTPTRCRESFQDAFLRAWRGDVENDGYNRLVLRARPDVARDHRAAGVGRYLRQAGTTFSDSYVEQALVVAPATSRGCSSSSSAPASTPTARRPARRGGSRPSGSSEAIDAVESLDQDRILRTFLGVIQAMLRTNYFQHAAGRAAEAAHLVQARPLGPALAAAAAAAVRDLRLLAAHRGRAPARRQGRARRHPLVRPARGLPHRGARPDEGADGQERRDRAGRREGRLRGQAAARRATARRCSRRSRPATAPSSAGCST